MVVKIRKIAKNFNIFYYYLKKSRIIPGGDLYKYYKIFNLSNAGFIWKRTWLPELHSNAFYPIARENCI